eukprot:gene9165-10115_t
MSKTNNNKVLFGDYFGQRADYSNGIFYGGHRKYLNSNGTSSFEPPNEFKSKRHLLHMRMSRAGSADERAKSTMFQVNFQQKKGDNDDVDAYRKLRRAATYVRDIVTLNHFSSTRPEDWVEEEQAGVHLWVNKVTGEVSAHCPWQPESDTSHSDILRSDPSLSSSKAGEIAEGTGSLVYDSSELNELWGLLSNTK